VEGEALRRISKLTAALLVVVSPTAAGVTWETSSPWPMSRFDSALTAFNQKDTGINPRNISDVRLLYTVRLDNPYGDGAPVVDHGVLFEESYSIDGPPGMLEAFAADCEASGCPPHFGGQ
jgi:hypothetical protein